MGLVAHYNMEQSSGALEDKANNNDSTSVAVTSRTATGILGGNAYDFDGTDDFVDLPFGTSFPNTGTISAWVYPHSTFSSSEGSIVDSHDSAGPDTLGVICSILNGEWRIYYGGVQATSSVGLSANEWSFYTATCDSNGDVTLYHNATEIASASGTPDASSTENFRVGRRPNDTIEFDGRIDEVRIYDHALTPQEVQYLYSVSQRGDYVSSTKST